MASQEASQVEFQEEFQVEFQGVPQVQIREKCEPTFFQERRF